MYRGYMIADIGRMHELKATGRGELPPSPSNLTIPHYGGKSKD